MVKSNIMTGLIAVSLTFNSTAFAMKSDISAIMSVENSYSDETHLLDLFKFDSKKQDQQQYKITISDHSKKVYYTSDAGKKWQLAFEGSINEIFVPKNKQKNEFDKVSQSVLLNTNAIYQTLYRDPQTQKIVSDSNHFYFRSGNNLIVLKPEPISESKWREQNPGTTKEYPAGFATKEATQFSIPMNSEIFDSDFKVYFPAVSHFFADNKKFEIVTVESKKLGTVTYFVEANGTTAIPLVKGALKGELTFIQKDKKIYFHELDRAIDLDKISVELEKEPLSVENYHGISFKFSQELQRQRREGTEDLISNIDIDNKLKIEQQKVDLKKNYGVLTSSSSQSSSTKTAAIALSSNQPSAAVQSSSLQNLTNVNKEEIDYLTALDLQSKILDNGKFSYNNETYQVLSSQGDEKNETHLIRLSDNKIVVLTADKRETVSYSVKIEKGIMDYSGIPRKIDLLAFDREAEFVPQGKADVIDAEQNKVNPVEVVDSVFENLYSRKEKPLALTESDLKIAKSIEKNIKKSERGSVVLLGEPGTGKTTIVKQALKNLPRTWRVKKLDAAVMNSGAGRIGILDTRVNAMIQASDRVPIIWFADEIHTLKGIGTHSGNSNDVLEYLKTPLANGIIKMVATDTSTEYYEKINDPAIWRRLSTIEIKSPEQNELFEKINNWLESNKRQNDVSQEMRELVVEVAHDFNAAEQEPSRSMGLLDAVLAELRHGEAVTSDLIYKTAAELYKIDPALRDKRVMRDRVKSLEKSLSEIIVGQDYVIQDLIKQSRAAITNLHDDVGPRVSMFLTGPYGLGKTELAKGYAKAMGLPSIVIEMSRYGGTNDKTGEDLMAEIAKQIRTNPFSVIVLDEVEKARAEVLQALLTMMSSESFTAYESAHGTQNKRRVLVSSKNSTLIMTSNAGAEKVSQYFQKLNPKAFERKRSDFTAIFHQAWAKQAGISAGIPMALMDRVHSKLVAMPPTTAELTEILKSYLTKRQAKISSRMKLDVDFLNIHSYIEQVVAHSKKKNLSTRDSIQLVRDHLNTKAASIQDHDDYFDAKKFSVDLQSDKVASILEISKAKTLTKNKCVMLFAK